MSASHNIKRTEQVHSPSRRNLLDDLFVPKLTPEPRLAGAEMTFSSVLISLFAGILLLIQPLGRGQRGSYRTTVQATDKLLLPDLPYGYEDLEPFLDSATLRVHHGGHHLAYTTKTNTALEQWRAQVLKP